MKNAVLLHGKPSKSEYFDASEPSCSNYHWFPWMQKQLLMQGIDTQTPEMLNAWQPDYKLWSETFSQYHCSRETLLVGHSCGGGFLVRYLSEHPDVTPDTLVLVAPWTDIDRTETTDFFDFTIDPHLIERVRRLVIFASDDDMPSIHKTVRQLREAFPAAVYREFQGYGHFTVESMPNMAFPELLTELML